MNLVSIQNLKFGYTSDIVLDGLSLEVAEGEVCAILGENGTGKSTLLKLLLGEIKPQQGKIELFGKNPCKLKSYKAIGYVPQIQTMHKIAFPMTCLELVTLNLYEGMGLIKIPSKADKAKGIKVLQDMGLGEYIHTPLNELSGGFQQRAMIARAMINEPSLLILDEPTAGVDKGSKVAFLKLVKRLNDEKNLTIIVVTHEVDLVQQHLELDHIYKMDDGRLVEQTVRAEA